MDAKNAIELAAIVSKVAFRRLLKCQIFLFALSPTIPSILCNFIDTIRVFGVACKMILVLFITRIPRIICIIILLFVAFSVYTFCMSTEKFSEPKLHDAWKCWRRVQTTPMSTIINQTKYKFRMILFSLPLCWLI